MSRGRPKGSKNKMAKTDIMVIKPSTVLADEVISTDPDTETSTVAASDTVATSDTVNSDSAINFNNIRVVCNCDICQAPIYSSPYKVQLQNITGRATWHRNCKVEKMSLCEHCAQELNLVVDAFILKKNPSLSKWPDLT